MRKVACHKSVLFAIATNCKTEIERLKNQVANLQSRLVGESSLFCPDIEAVPRVGSAEWRWYGIKLLQDREQIQRRIAELEQSAETNKSEEEGQLRSILQKL